MDDDDKGFFILVLGVLAAVVTLVSWWALRDDDRVVVAADSALVAMGDDHDDDHMDDHDHDHEHGEEGHTDADHEEHMADPDHEHDEDHDEHMAEIEADDDQQASADAADEDAGDDTAASTTDPGLSVLAALSTNPDLSSAAELIVGAGLADPLDEDGPYTVLAPTNAAIGGIDAAAAERLLSGDTASDVARYHVLEGSYSIDDLAGLVDRGSRSAEVATITGETISIALDGDNVIINDNAVISASDDSAGNGVVHSIDNLLVPREAALNLIVGLEPIQFASGSATISAESTATLDQVVEALGASDASVTVEGHTDSQGDPAANLALSQARAEAVVAYLVANGVDAERLSAEGFGPDRPVADNETEAGRAQNRRIEFRIE